MKPLCGKLAVATPAYTFADHGLDCRTPDSPLGMTPSRIDEPEHILWRGQFPLPSLLATWVHVLILRG